MPKLLTDGAGTRGDPWTIKMEVFFSTCLRLHVHSHTYFLLLQRSQKVSVCAQKRFPILHPLSAPTHQVGERCTTSFRESLAWGCSKAGASEWFFPLVSLASFFILFFLPPATTELLPKCVFHMFPISHALCLTNLLPVPLADAINLLPTGSRAQQQNSRQRS